jgi:hypothetical protein
MVFLKSGVIMHISIEFPRNDKAGFEGAETFMLIVMMVW